VLNSVKFSSSLERFGNNCIYDSNVMSIIFDFSHMYSRKRALHLLCAKLEAVSAGDGSRALQMATAPTLEIKCSSGRTGSAQYQDFLFQCAADKLLASTVNSGQREQLDALIPMYHCNIRRFTTANHGLCTMLDDAQCIAVLYRLSKLTGFDLHGKCELLTDLSMEAMALLLPPHVSHVTIGTMPRVTRQGWSHFLDNVCLPKLQCMTCQIPYDSMVRQLPAKFPRLTTVRLLRNRTLPDSDVTDNTARALYVGLQEAAEESQLQDRSDPFVTSPCGTEWPDYEELEEIEESASIMQSLFQE
jgi:hypothetical protein